MEVNEHLGENANIVLDLLQFTGPSGELLDLLFILNTMSVSRIDERREARQTFFTKLLISALACSRSSAFRLFSNRCSICTDGRGRRWSPRSAGVVYLTLFCIGVEDRFTFAGDRGERCLGHVNGVFLDD